MSEKPSHPVCWIVQRQMNKNEGRLSSSAKRFYSEASAREAARKYAHKYGGTFIVYQAIAAYRPACCVEEVEFH